MSIVNIFNLTPSLIDNNQKVDLNVAVAELQLFSDEFGDALDAHWTIGDDGWGHAENGSVAEAGGEVALSCTGAVGAYRGKGIHTPYVFNDLTVEVDYHNWVKGPGDPQFNSALLLVQKDANNVVVIRRYYDGPNDYISAHKGVGGVFTTIGTFNTLALDFGFRIVRSGNNFDVYYNVGAGWVQLGVTTAAAIGADCSVYNSLFARGAGTTTVDDMYCRITGSGYYWNDNPEIYVIDNALVEWAFDAVTGTWNLSGASAVLTEPGVSTVKFKVGWSDDGTFVGTTWVDVAWQTIAQVNANAVAGLYDGHRYLHVQAQHHSTGPDQPTLTSFSITGSTGLPRGLTYHNRRRRLRYDIR